MFLSQNSCQCFVMKINNKMRWNEIKFFTLLHNLEFKIQMSFRSESTVLEMGWRHTPLTFNYELAWMFNANELDIHSSLLLLRMLSRLRMEWIVLKIVKNFWEFNFHVFFFNGAKAKRTAGAVWIYISRHHTMRNGYKLIN